MEWLIWGVAIWFALAVMGRRGCSWNAWGPRRLHQLKRSPSHRVTTPRPRPQQRVTAPRETAEERIRRRFVEGRIDLDQYEAELWEELRPGRSSD